MSTYIHDHEAWPELHWIGRRLEEPLGKVRHHQGRLIGRMEALGFPLQSEAVLQALTQEVLKSSEIEGEMLDLEQVRSSIARRLGMDAGGLTPSDRNVEGVVQMMLDATQNYSAPLTKERLFGWHAALFPDGWSGIRRIKVGNWRTADADPMQVVSGPPNRPRVHYEAPRASRLAREMAVFLKWFNSETHIDPVVKAGLAHLWFVTIHPFEDGNGRIARAIADMVLARSDNSPQRFYSMSAQIRVERAAYYATLEATQKGRPDVTQHGGLDVTGWLEWFLGCLDRALDRAEDSLGAVLKKAQFWERHTAVPLNPRQRAMLVRLLDGFEGKLTSGKWAQLTKASQDTALRDIEAMLKAGILTKDPAGGRSTSYSLAEI